MSHSPASESGSTAAPKPRCWPRRPLMALLGSLLLVGPWPADDSSRFEGERLPGPDPSAVSGIDPTGPDGPKVAEAVEWTSPRPPLGHERNNRDLASSS